jgi:RNA polymerase sigma factor (sigma-70 family)
MSGVRKAMETPQPAARAGEANCPTVPTAPTARVEPAPPISATVASTPPVISISSSTLQRDAGTAINAPTRPPARPTVADPGSPEGFAAAFPSLFRLAYQVAFRVLGERGDAEDVAQEALARAVLRWRSLAERPEGWVVRVASNLAIDRYRRRRRSLPTPATTLAASDPAVADRLDLASAIARLPRRQREVVVMRYLADWREEDVARELGCSVGNVKSSASRGIKALRRHLGDKHQEPRDDVPAS